MPVGSRGNKKDFSRGCHACITSKGREGFAWLRVWAFKESDRKDEIQNPVSVVSDVPSILVCKNTGVVCTRGSTGLLSTSMRVLLLTVGGEHEIPEKRELVDDNDRHLETQRNLQNGAG